MEKLKFNKSGSCFYEELKEEEHKKLGKTHAKWGTDRAFWLKALFWFICCWGTYLAILFQAIEGQAILPAFLLIYISGLLLGFSIGHDASHKVISRHSLINKALHYISFLTVGIDPILWGLRHVRSHHLYANVEGSDIDIDKNPLLRLSPTHPWKSIHKYQHLYAPFAYFLALVHSVFWGDWVYLIHKDYNWMRRGNNPIILWCSFITFKIIHFFLMIFLPMTILKLSFKEIFLIYFICGGITSLIFIVMLVGTHFFLEANYFSSPPNRQLNHSWAEHNLQTSCDWNPESSFARFISGGANCHAAHHLFPNICHTHYGLITPIVREVTNKFGIKYHSMTLPQMIVSHFKHLKKMGEN